MLSLDDRAGNVVATVALFLAAAVIVYLARGAFLILLLSLLFAYLLEPLVTWVQHHSWLGKKNRTWAIAQVYLIGTLVLGGLGYEYGPHLAAQIKNLNAAVPEILESFSSGKAPVGLGAAHGLSASQQLRLQQLVVRHHDFIVQAFERGASSAALCCRKRNLASRHPNSCNLHLAGRTSHGGDIRRSGWIARRSNTGQANLPAG